MDILEDILDHYSTIIAGLEEAVQAEAVTTNEQLDANWLRVKPRGRKSRPRPMDDTLANSSRSKKAKSKRTEDYVCKTCGKPFPENRAWWMHMWTHVEQEDEENCDQVDSTLL